MSFNKKLFQGKKKALSANELANGHLSLFTQLCGINSCLIQLSANHWLLCGAVHALTEQVEYKQMGQHYLIS